MRKVLAVFLVGAFVLLLLPVWEFAAVAPKGNGALAGHIYNEDMRTPVRNAVVKLRNVTTLKEYVSDPTDTEGMYTIPAIEEGRYVMGVQAPTGSYNFHYSIMIKSDALAKLSVAMKPGSRAGHAPVGIRREEKIQHRRVLQVPGRHHNGPERRRRRRCSPSSSSKRTSRRRSSLIRLGSDQTNSHKTNRLDSFLGLF